MVPKGISCALWIAGLIAKTAAIFVLIAGYNGTLDFSAEQTTGLGLSLLLLGIIFFFFGVYYHMHHVHRERMEQFRSHTGSIVLGPDSENVRIPEPPSGSNDSVAAPATHAAEAGRTQYAESHEMTDMAAQNGEVPRPDAPAIIHGPPSQPLPPRQEAIEVRGRSPLGLYPPLRYSSSVSYDSKDLVQQYSDSRKTSRSEGQAIEAAKQSFPDPVVVRHVRFAVPLVPPKATSTIVSSKGPLDSVALESTTANDSSANKLSFHNYKVENGKITDIMTGELVNTAQLYKPQMALSNPELDPGDAKKPFGVARTLQHTFKVGDGMFLDFSSLESAILRGGGSLKAGLDSEVAKGKESLKAWKSTSSLRALLRNPSRSGNISEMEFV